jgi:RNA polymerase sigma factor (sigma-70 family)
VNLPPFQSLLDAHGAHVYRFLVATAGPNEADDCYQETWIAALRAYPKLTSTDNLRGWLLKIAQRKAIDAHRARGRRPLPAESLPERAVALAAAPTAPRSGSALNAEPELWTALRDLPPKQRTAVFGRSVLELGYPELAELLDSSEDAARRNVHEGLKRLKKEWKP